MIRLLEPADLPAELDARQTVCAARICTLRDAWAGLPARCGAPDFYSTDEGSVLAVMETVCTLDGEGFDAEELHGFLRMRGCETLVCSGGAARLLGTEDLKTKKNPVLRRDHVGAEPDVRVNWEPPLPQVYRLLADTFDNMSSVRFDVWYADLSLKIRRGIARIAGVLENDVLRSTAGIYHRNACTAVLGSVATEPAMRGNGYAGALVNALAAWATAGGRTALIVAMNPHARALYERLGFGCTDELCELTLETAGAVRMELNGEEAED